MENNIDKIRHSLAHVLASAVLEIYSKTKLGMGPAVENGFYYDFDLPKSLEPSDLEKIEEKMKGIISKNQKFIKKDVTKLAAKKLFKDQPYKLELIKELPGKNVSIYANGDFTDLCKGPHIKNTSEIKPNTFKLTKIAGAYWKGDEKRPMLQRIYGVAFKTKKGLDEYLKKQAESVSLADIVKTVERVKPSLRNCTKRLGCDCSQKKCAKKDIWAHVERRVWDALDKVTLQQMM